MQELNAMLIVDLLEEIVKNKGDYEKISFNSFKNALGELSSFLVFKKTEIPFDFADPVTTQKIEDLINMLGPLEKEISEGVLSTLPQDIISVIEEKYKSEQNIVPLKDFLIKMYLRKICSMHPELMEHNEMVFAKKKLFDSVISNHLKISKKPQKNADKKLDSPRSPRRKLKASKSSPKDYIYQYIDSKDISTLDSFSFFNEIKDNEQFIQFIGKNTKALFEHKKWRDTLIPPYNINIVERMLEIIHDIRNDFIENENYLKLVDKKTEDLSNQEKINALYYLIGSYAAKVFSQATLGHPKKSDLMQLFSYVYQHYEQKDDPKTIYEKLMQDIGKQHTDYFFEMAYPEYLFLDAEEKAKPKPSMLFHAVSEIIDSVHFRHIQKSILSAIKEKDEAYRLVLLEACKEINTSGLNDELSTEAKCFFEKLYDTLHKNIDSSILQDGSQSSLRESNLGSSHSSSTSSSRTHTSLSDNLQMASGLFTPTSLKTEKSMHTSLSSSSAVTLPKLPDFSEIESKEEYSDADSEIETPKSSRKPVKINN